MSTAIKKLKSFFEAEHSKGTLLFLSFSITFTVLIIAFLARGIAPFGKNGLIAMDGYGQYFPMLRGIRNAIHSGSSLEYSFSGACGFNLWTQNAYYTNSPLWLPLYFVPYKWMAATLDLIVAVRISLASMLFCLRLTHGKNKDKLSVVLFALCYGLCGWSLAYINQFMWADAFMLLPIVVLGIEEIAQNKSLLTYTLTLGAVLWSNFYVGYMVCLFSVMYFVILLIGEKRRKKRTLKITAKFILGSIIAGGLSAAVLIPTYLSLQKTIASTLCFEGEICIYHSLKEILLRLLPLQKISLEYGAPNLYCGIICVAFPFVALFSSKISIRKKIAYSLGVVFLFVSFNINLLDYIWHGMHYPNQLPGRQSFLFCFMIVNAAYVGWNVLIKANIFRKIKFLPASRGVCACLALILTAELLTNSFWSIGTQTWTAKLTNYTSNDEDMNAVLKKYDHGYKDFWRIELLYPQNNNAGQLYGYNGISYYSSTMSKSAYDTFLALGNGIYAQNVSTKYSSNAPNDDLFGIRYVLELTNQASGEDLTSYDGLELVDTIGKIKVYENKDYLSLGFLADKSVKNLKLTKDDPTGNLNSIFKLTGATPNNIIAGKDKIKFDELEAAINRLNKNALIIKSFSETKIIGTIECDRDGILFLTIPNDGGWKIEIDGKKCPVTTLAGYFLGTDIEQGQHNVTITYRTPGLNAGIIISMISLAGIIAIIILKRRKKNTPST